MKVGYTVSILGLLAACCDGLENVFLLSMASNPIDFPSWLAIPHSLFANIKFDLMYIASAWIFFALAYVVARWIVKPRSPVLTVSEVVQSHTRTENQEQERTQASIITTQWCKYVKY
jgi:hypothetical protein